MKVRASVKKWIGRDDWPVRWSRPALTLPPQPEQHPLYMRALQLIPSCWYIAHPGGGCLLRSLGEVPEHGLVVERVSLGAYRDRKPNGVIPEDVFVLNAEAPTEGDYVVRGGRVQTLLNAQAQIRVSVLRHMADQAAFYRARKDWTQDKLQTFADQLECAKRLAKDDL